jgi:hypothetical protein
VRMTAIKFRTLKGLRISVSFPKPSNHQMDAYPKRINTPAIQSQTLPSRIRTVGIIFLASWRLSRKAANDPAYGADDAIDGEHKDERDRYPRGTGEQELRLPVKLPWRFGAEYL